MSETGFDLVRASMAVEGITAPEQSVLTVLAVMANDAAKCWPGIATLIAKTKLSERSVQRAVQALRDAGHIEWQDNPGKGRLYTVHPRHSGTPVTEAPPPESHPTPATVAPKLPRTTNTSQKASPSSSKRATSVPANFVPVMGAKTKATVDGWPPGRLDDEIEHFADHHTAKGTKSFDWQASWRTWVANSKKWEPRNGRFARQSDPSPGLRLRDGSDDPIAAMWAEADAEQRAESATRYPQADFGDRLSLPSYGG